MLRHQREDGAFRYPYFGYSVLTALDALFTLGYTASHPGVASAVDYLRSRQGKDGTWPLDQAVFRPPADFGLPGQPNKWITLDALRVLRRAG